jgi:phospholipase C
MREEVMHPLKRAFLNGLRLRAPRGAVADGAPRGREPIPKARAFVAVGGLTSIFAAAPPTTADAVVSQIRHVVIVVQENRTPDNLFGAFVKELPTADLATTGKTSKGKVVKLTPVALGDAKNPANVYDLGHGHHAFVRMYDHGRMDGADRIGCSLYKGATTERKCPADPQFRYVKGAEVRPYLEIAQKYGFANRMFQTNQGASFPAHQFILAGTSQVTAKSPLFAAENPSRANLNVRAGCVAPAQARVAVIGPSGVESDYRPVYPCFEHQTLTDLLNRHHPPISWRYYTPLAGSIWTAPNAIRHICEPSHGKCVGLSWINGQVVLSPPRVLTDIAEHKLAAVSWVVPNGYYSDHAGVNEGTGPSWLAAIVNAIGKSSYWEKTAILITWDDWGGWYDHVAPPSSKGRPFGYYELGFRVPLLVVSPYTPEGYVSSKDHDFGSILRFVETVFGLGRIPPGDFADARADDLGDFFDFKTRPRAFASISAPLPPGYFIADPRPSLDPDDD